MAKQETQFSRVFVGSASESLTVAESVQINLHQYAEVRVWNQGLFKPADVYLDNILEFAQEFDFAIFIWTADDLLQSRGSVFATPRDNVQFEAGIFFASLGRNRVFLLIEETDNIKIPSDLNGISVVSFRKPTDGNYPATLIPACTQLKERIKSLGSKTRHSIKPKNVGILPEIYSSRREAWETIKTDCKEAVSISIAANRGVMFFGTDDSLISLAGTKDYENLKKIRMVLLSDRSTWLHDGYIQMREYESLDIFKKELVACHEIVESAMRRFSRQGRSSKSGIKYHRGEPHFRMLLTDKAAYVSSYAEPPGFQSKDLPVYRFEKTPGSMYGALKRYMDDLWHNNSSFGSYQKDIIDLETSAGGIVLFEDGSKTFLALLRRDDGYWVLPKGHKMKVDGSLETTAIREVAEETGLSQKEINIEQYLGHYSFDESIESRNSNKVVHLFLMKNTALKKPILRASDHAQASWWPINKKLPEMKSSSQASYVESVIDKLLKQ